MIDRKALFDEHRRLAEKIFTSGLSEEEHQRLIEVRGQIDDLETAELSLSEGLLGEEIRREMASILTEGSPDFMKCKEAGKRLHAQMKSEGFQLTGVGVGVSADRKHPTIHIMLHHKPKSPKIPETFEGFQVDIVVTGAIRPLKAE